MGKILKIALTGSYEDQENVRFSALINELSAILDGLVSIDKEASSGFRENVYYRVVRLSHDSPASLELEAVPYEPAVDTGEVVFTRFVRGWDYLTTGKALPDEYTPEVRRAFNKIRSGMEDNLTKLTFSINGEKAELTSATPSLPMIQEQSDRESFGSIIGPMEAINIHGRNEFRIYPDTGANVIRCYFKEDLRSVVLTSIGKRVRVYGKLKYFSGSEYPSEILVREIKTMSEIGAKSTLMELRGIAPGCTGDLTTEDFLEKLRNREW